MLVLTRGITRTEPTPYLPSHEDEHGNESHRPVFWLPDHPTRSAFPAIIASGISLLSYLVTVAGPRRICTGFPSFQAWKVTCKPLLA